MGYLWERSRLLVWTLSIGHPSNMLFNAPGNPDYPPKFPAANKDGYSYLSYLAQGSDHQTGDWLYDGWIYALILIIGAATFARRSQAEQVIVAMCVGMILYTIVLAFSGPGFGYR